MANILIVEDDITFTQILEGFLKKNGYQVDVRHKIKEAEKALAENSYDLILLDYQLPDGHGTDLLKALRAAGQKVPAIMMTSFHDVKIAVSAIKLGAIDYITKPVNPDELKMVIKDALAPKDLPKQKAAQRGPFIEGSGEKSKQLVNYINLVAPTDMSILIQGESGTGKEQVARTIHKLSKRSAGPFMAIDCGALSTELAASELFGHIKGAFTGAVQDKKGQFEMANGGTLFLDEIGNLNYDIQVKLLRVLQEKVVQAIGSHTPVEIDVRIIAATNDDLTPGVKNNGFREDLYHRLNEFKITVPALRQRQEDLELFVNHFIELSNAELGKEIKKVSAEVMQLFKKYEWPGNLRELKNMVKRAVLLSETDTIQSASLPDEMTAVEPHSRPLQSESDLKAMQEVNEREAIVKTLRDVKYNKSKAARLLNIDRKTLYAKLEKYNIEH